MRHFKVVFTPEGGAFHSADGLLADSPDLTRKAFLHIDLLNDGTGVALYQLEGDPTAVEGLFADRPDVLAFDVFNVDGETFNLSVHFRPDDPATTLLRIADRYKLVVDPPLEFTDEGGLRVTIAGTQEMIQRAVRDLPREVRVRLEQTGEYDPERGSLVTQLTDRQQEVLEAAVRLGYYATPRRATHDDIAAELGCSAGTVGEHLRKVEARVLSTLV